MSFRYFLCLNNKQPIKHTLDKNVYKWSLNLIVSIKLNNIQQDKILGYLLISTGYLDLLRILVEIWGAHTFLDKFSREIILNTLTYICLFAAVLLCSYSIY